MHVNYYTKKNEIFISTGFLDDHLMFDAGFYQGLSELWEEDPLHTKTLTCSECGPGVRAVYYCTSGTCHLGICYQCYSQRMYPDSKGICWPSLNSWTLPLAFPHGDPRGCHHGNVAPSVDKSFVIDPFIVVHVLGLGVDQKAVSDQKAVGADVFFTRDHCITAGAGVFSYTLKPRVNSSQLTVEQMAKQIGLQMVPVRARRLLIIVHGHAAGGSVTLAGVPYSTAQLFSHVFRPLVSAFRGSLDRALSPVVAVLNSCDAAIGTWDQFVQSEPAATGLELVICRKPILFKTISDVIATFVRGWANRVLYEANPSFTTAQALARAMHADLVANAEPAVLTPGRLPTVKFRGPDVVLGAQLANALVSPPTVSTSTQAVTGHELAEIVVDTESAHAQPAFGPGAGVPVQLPPDWAQAAQAVFHHMAKSVAGAAAQYAMYNDLLMHRQAELNIRAHDARLEAAAASVAAASSSLPVWSPSERNAAVLEWVVNLTDQARRDTNLTEVSGPDLLKALCNLAVTLKPADTAPTFTNFADLGSTFRAWRAKYWTFNAALSQFMWAAGGPATAAAGQSGAGASASDSSQPD